MICQLRTHYRALQRPQTVLACYHTKPAKARHRPHVRIMCDIEFGQAEHAAYCRFSCLHGRAVAAQPTIVTNIHDPEDCRHCSPSRWVGGPSHRKRGREPKTDCRNHSQVPLVCFICCALMPNRCEMNPPGQSVRTTRANLGTQTLRGIPPVRVTMITIP